MPRPAFRLDDPVSATVSRMALRYVRAASRAAKRLREADDGTALHALRVAVRRLRSLLGAYRGQLRGVSGKKDRRRLRRLTRVTGPVRDLEVQLAALTALRGRVGGEERRRVDRMRRTLARRRPAAYATMREALDPRCRRTLKALRRHLRDGAEAEDGTPLRLAVGPLLVTHARALRRDLDAVGSPRAVAALHRARIGAKRLRYVVEPIAHAIPGGVLATQRLRALQGLLGSLHDLHALEAALAPPRTGGAAGRLLREDAERTWATLERTWRRGRARASLDALERLGARLGEHTAAPGPAQAPPAGERRPPLRADALAAPARRRA